MSERGAAQLDSSRTGRVASINLSSGGVPKKAVNVAMVTHYRVDDDAQNDTRNHGGPERAVCIYSLEVIRALQAEGHPIDIGTAGENVTVEGIDWSMVAPGARVRIGDSALLEIASFTGPCKTIKGSFIDGKFIRISEKLHPGWSRVYARVISEGQIRQGDAVRVISTAD